MDESEVKYYTCSIKFTKTVKLFKISIHNQIHPSNEFVKICSWSQKCHHLKNISIESNKALCINNHNAFYDVAADGEDELCQVQQVFALQDPADVLLPHVLA